MRTHPLLRGVMNIFMIKVPYTLTIVSSSLVCGAKGGSGLLWQLEPFCECSCWWTKILGSRQKSREEIKMRFTRKKLFDFFLTRVGLLCVICIYLLAGAFLFQYLESKYELTQQGLAQQEKLNCLRELWIITGNHKFV